MGNEMGDDSMDVDEPEMMERYLLLSPKTVLAEGLRYLSNCITDNRASKHKQNEVFHAHYGSSPFVIATIWYDLISAQTGDIPDELLLTEQERKSTKAFKMFLTSHSFLWCYDKNASMSSFCPLS